MDTERLWDNFIKSGSVNDYLKYINLKDLQNDDN